MAGESGLIVAGIPIPSADPMFLAALAVHVPAGILCVLAGLTAMLSRKGSERHVLAGRAYFWALAVLCAAAAALAAMRWAEDRSLFALGALALAAAWAGRAAWRRRSGAGRHILGMGASYILMLTAFYVDLGPSLPLWRHLPHWAFWVLPAMIGAPLTIRARRRWRPA